ncbi:protein YibB [Campylobacter troglodytis]|uniref:protein YibB n=1 Tax=Campylobacter troglodytis TaxID=654363 RepID=UPI00115BC12C|nr:protein YibB [Campylobacter troglodytis]TQR61003.1 protein YibB [Campylobacter troglodytis]
MNAEITIVTAFYDIGRASIKGFERDYKRYIEYFSFWAGLKNELVIFTSEDFADEILAVREKLGLKDKTKIVVKELESFDSEALSKMREVFANFNQSKGRKNPQNIECISAEYDYLMYCKPFFVCDAIEKGLTGDKVLWLDFGFNHGTDFFTDKSQFNFTLSVQEGLKDDKINFFALKDKEEAHLAQLYYSMDVYLIGGLIYGGCKVWAEFKKHFSEALRAFLSLQLVDDDQIFLIWCARNYPQSYNIVRNKGHWFDSLSFFIPPQIRLNLNCKEARMKPHKKAKKAMQEALSQKLYLKALFYALKYIFKKLFK